MYTFYFIYYSCKKRKINRICNWEFFSPRLWKPARDFNCKLNLINKNKKQSELKFMILDNLKHACPTKDLEGLFFFEEI